jgi:hypothetical protein
VPSYCEASDLYDHGLPRGAAPNPGRLASSVDADADTIALDVHGFDTDAEVVLRADAGGTMPGGLTALATYYAIPVTEGTFKVSATEGGDAVDITSEGSGLVVIAPLPIAAAIAWASRMIDQFLIGHVVPLEEPIPDLVRMTCAELAAGKVLARTGGGSRALSAIVDDARKRLEKWGRGVPLRGENKPTSANTAVSSATAAYADRRGWSRYGGIT